MSCAQKWEKQKGDAMKYISENQTRWIRADKCLPWVADGFLTYICDPQYGDYVCCIYFNGKEFERDLIGTDGVITHWKSLPDPPKDIYMGRAKK